MTRTEIDQLTANAGQPYAALCHSALARQELHRVINWFNTMAARVPHDQITEHDRELVARITNMLNHKGELDSGTETRRTDGAGTDAADRLGRELNAIVRTR